MNDQRDLLTIDEAADILRTPIATLRYWRFTGQGPNGFKMGRRVYFKRQDVLDWIDLQAAKPRGAK